MSSGPSATQSINLDADINRELAAQQEIIGSTKELTEFDATPPQYVTSLGRGLWPKPDPHEIRLPRAFYESKGLLSSRSQPVKTQGPLKRSLGRGSVLSKYGSTTRPGHAPSSMTDDTATTSREILTPADLEEGKAALMQRFLGTQGGPNAKPVEAPGEGSLVFSSMSGSVKTLPDVRCKENFPSLLDDNVCVQVKASHSDVGGYKKPSQKSRKATSLRDEKQLAESNNQIPLKTSGAYGGDGAPAVSGFKDLASEIRNSNPSSSEGTKDGTARTSKIGKGRGRGRIRRMESEFHEDFLRAGDLGDVVLEQDEAQLNPQDLLTGPNCLQVECLPTDITQEEVVDLFALFGSVLDCHIVRDAHTKDCIGISHVRMSSDKECQMAIATLHEQESPFPGRYPKDISPDLLVTINSAR